MSSGIRLTSLLLSGFPFFFPVVCPWRFKLSLYCDEVYARYILMYLLTLTFCNNKCTSSCVPWQEEGCVALLFRDPWWQIPSPPPLHGGALAEFASHICFLLACGLVFSPLSSFLLCIGQFIHPEETVLIFTWFLSFVSDETMFNLLSDRSWSFG